MFSSTSRTTTRHKSSVMTAARISPREVLPRERFYSVERSDSICVSSFLLRVHENHSEKRPESQRGALTGGSGRVYDKQYVCGPAGDAGGEEHGMKKQDLRERGSGWALAPFVVFIVIYLGAGLVLQARGDRRCPSISSPR